MNGIPQYFRVRAIQAVVGLSYCLLAAIAVARAQSLLDMGVAVAMLLGTYLTGRVIPDVWIERKDVLRVCGVALLVILAGIAADIAGGHGALGWAVVVMAYCGGSRLKAAGIGVAA